MSHQGVQDGCKMLTDNRDVKNIRCIGLKTVFTLVGDDNDRSLMCLEYRRILYNISDYRSPGSGGANKDQRFR